MRLTAYPLLAVSLLAAATLGDAAQRPRYGGSLRVELEGAPMSLDPAAGQSPDARSEAARERLGAAVFEGLTRRDERGRPEPALAVSWQIQQAGKRWLFHLRPDVKFHDGSLLTSAVCASALAPLRPDWIVSPASDAIAIQLQRAQPELAFELASPRYAIVLRGNDGALAGTGPFRIAQFEPAQHVVLRGHPDYWGGRPFLDEISALLGRTAREQEIDLELGKADLIETAPAVSRRVQQSGSKLWESEPVQLIALAFERGRPQLEDSRLREAVALSIDRAAIHSVLLQKQGEPTGALLPQWLSGYAFLFSAARDSARAKELAAVLPPPAPALAIGYDSGDPMLRIIADRIALNARDAGLRVQPSSRAIRPELRLVRIRLTSPWPAEALTALAASLKIDDLLSLSIPASPDSCYAAEQRLLSEFWIVPIVHLPETYASRPAVSTWQTPGLLKTGHWRFDDLWIAPERP